VGESAARVLRKELQAAQRAAVKFAADAPGWASWVEAFYADHHVLVMQTMRLDEPTAKAYVALQRAELLDGLAATERWTADYLADLALDTPTHDPMPGLLKSAIERPSPDVHVPVTIAKGAMQVDVAAAAPPHVEVPVTIAKGAIHHETHVAAPARNTTVTKTVKRDAKNQITQVIEEQAD
jgi:hypothetical protein